MRKVFLSFRWRTVQFSTSGVNKLRMSSTTLEDTAEIDWSRWFVASSVKCSKWQKTSATVRSVVVVSKGWACKKCFQERTMCRADRYGCIPCLGFYRSTTYCDLGVGSLETGFVFSLGVICTRLIDTCGWGRLARFMLPGNDMWSHFMSSFLKVSPRSEIHWGEGSRVTSRVRSN